MRVLALFLLLLSGPTMAQTTAATPAATTPTMAPPAARTAADTVRALHRLFQRRRRTGGYLVSGAVAADLVLAGVSAASENSESKGSGGSGYGNFTGSGPLIQFGMGGYALLWGVALAPVAGVGVQQLIAYNARHEAKIIASYERTHQLPARWQRRVRKHLR
jgi:hypothetical protein